MGGVFDGSKCGMPFIPAISGVLVPDCRVRTAPPPIIDPSTPTFSPISGVLDQPRRTILAQLTGVDTTQTNNPYSWTRVIPGGTGAIVTTGEAGSNVGTDPNYDPAYAFDNSPGVPIGSIVVLVRGYLNNDWRFASRADGAIPSVTSSSITTGTYASPTSFTVTLLGLSGGGPGMAATSITGLTAYNVFALGATIASPKFVWLTYFGGFLYGQVADCG